MPAVFVRRAVRTAIVLLLAACSSDSQEVGAERLKAVRDGMPRDSVMAILGTGPLTARYADTLRVDHGFRRSVYLVDGQTIEVLYYREQPGDVTEAVQQDTETPIVLADGKALGWGWASYADAMKQYNLPSPIEAPTPPAPSTASPAAPAARPDSGPKA
ncbi:MAG: DUF3192 domain-containing protein [Gemmatimonadota bacterium]|nr:DUF3192 domain-containing protein [Gemmatimonadota bacterium]MDQ8166204.1 DUF3192 domain-containing protein [Gemmatimonadota bacterium]MDQ8171537.1 DUF3192 domain-containing protein [Gemmatimonadota bacterium]